MNVIILSGVVCTEPELRITTGGKAVCKFKLAVKKSFKPQNGADADFHECQIWGKPAESFAQYNQKGAKVAVTGELNDNNYEGQDGQKRYGKIVNVAKWEFAGGKKEAEPKAEDEGFTELGDDSDILF